MFKKLFSLSGKHIRKDNSLVGNVVNTLKNKEKEKIQVYLSPTTKPLSTSANHLTCFTKKNQRMVLNFHVMKLKNDEVYLSDILVPKGDNRGFGSILLETLILVARKNKIKEISGELFYDDDEHKEIQVNFYQKFGFEVNLVTNKIKKNL